MLGVADGWVVVRFVVVAGAVEGCPVVGVLGFVVVIE